MTSPHSKKKCKSFFDMTDKQKKRIVERAARLSIEEQIRKYGSPEQKQESVGWEERLSEDNDGESGWFELDGETLDLKKLKSFISIELQEAERRGAKKCIDSILKVHDFLISEAFPKGEYNYGYIFLQLMELAIKFGIQYKKYEPVPSKLNKSLNK